MTFLAFETAKICYDFEGQSKSSGLKIDPFRQKDVAVRTQHVDVRPSSRRQRVAFGDFQTPPELAEQICQRLGTERPLTIVEPTCGEGSILAAAVRRFPLANRAIGFDISAGHAATARRRISEIQTGVDCEIRTDDFFRVDNAFLDCLATTI